MELAQADAFLDIMAVSVIKVKKILKSLWSEKTVTYLFIYFFGHPEISENF